MPTIRMDHVTKYYKTDGHIDVVLRDVSLVVEQGEFVFLVGSSGAGKSTLLNMMTGGIKPNKGSIYIGDRELQRTRRWDRRYMGLTFGQVWQESQLIRKRTIGENLEMIGRIYPHRKGKQFDLQARVHKVLGLVGLAGVEKKYPVELSGGECRRIELARALINSPPVLVLDELTANIDDDSIWDIFLLLHELNRRGTTVIMATHASSFVNIMRRRVVTLVDGRIVGDVRKGKYGDIV